MIKHKKILLTLLIAGCIVLMSFTIVSCTAERKDNSSEYLVIKLETLCGKRPYPCSSQLLCEGNTLTFDAKVKGTSNIFPKTSRFLIIVENPPHSTNKLGTLQVNIINDNSKFYDDLKTAANNNSTIEITAKIQGFDAPINGACYKGINFVANTNNIIFK